MDVLPTEIVIEIFKFLPPEYWWNLARVNRRWRSIIKTYFPQTKYPHECAVVLLMSPDTSNDKLNTLSNCKDAAAHG